MISIIVPVYNAMPHLTACVQSLVAQTCRDWELLLVDDGSTDGSHAECDRWAQQDARIRVIHQDNAGPSAARNAGLDVARGEQVAFVDADDVVHCRYLEVLLDAMQQYDADVVQAPYKIVPASRRSDFTAERLARPLPSAHAVVRTGEQALLDMLYQRGRIDSSPCKLFRRRLPSWPCFPSDVRVYEDLLFVADVLTQTRRTVWLNVPMYFYFKQASGTLVSTSTRQPDGLLALERLEGRFLSMQRQEWVLAVRHRCFSLACHTLRLLRGMRHDTGHRAEHDVMARLCWQQVERLRRQVFFNPQSRFKNRLVAAFPCLLKW